ncbi:phage tail tape measure protein [Luteibacter sp. SG786]|uniref:phage tail tape measure protein n=1 Tax=Luteibacter sp. SG786 TaxID=2587130 RepID=UPI0014236DA3|nr:phage tail tape measure protein [Luteibacter sp. SG786]NII53589.1 lambda family phage tail tape measure protein [Luteibacter sp. SG786]
MTEAESIGTARIDVTVNTATMETGVEAAKRKVSGLGAEAAAQFDKANASTKRYAESLNRQAELLGKSRAEQIAYNAQVRIGGELGDQIAKKALANEKALTQASESYVMSERARAAAMRGVPAQITDIVSGLATGQRPLSVLLQQGGQLKDMFGGVGAAAKALGASLLGLVNPATLLAGAAVALFAAWKSGSDEQVAFQKALINSGNYAGVTTQQLQGLAEELSRTSGTQHDAAAVLAEVAGSGKFTSDQLRLVASAAIAAGDGAEDMVARFAKLADDPVKASAELNSSYHYLTAAVYDQIQALEDQGRTQEAARLAMESYSAAVVSRSKDVKENLGFIEQAWNGITGATRRAIDAARDLGRAQTDQQRFDVLFENRDAAKKLVDRGLGSTAFLGKTAQQFYDDATKELGAMQDAQVAAQKKASRDAATQQANDAAIRLAQEAQQYESDETKRARQIAAIHQQANDAIAKATQVGDKALADKIRASEAAAVAGIMSKGPKEKDLRIDVSDGWKEMVAQIEKGISADKKEIEQRARATVELNSYREAMQQRLQTDRMALDIQVQSLGMGQHQIDIQRQLVDIQRDADRELARLNDPANRRTLTDDEYQARLAAIKEYEDQRVQLVYDADARLNAARADWTNGARRALADITYDASDTATSFANLVQSTYGSLSDFIVDAATTGKASIKDLVSSILKEVARLQANKAAASLLNYGLSYFTGGYGGTNGQGGVDYNSQGFVSKVYAKGGVVDGASLSNWSNTIVDRPTMFAFARGAGLMGEAGPEAIMPLTRTADGKLGVKQVGGTDAASVNVSVVVNADGSGDTTSEGDYQAWGKQLGENMRAIAQQELQRAMAPGGALWRARG